MMERRGSNLLSWSSGAGCACKLPMSHLKEMLGALAHAQKAGPAYRAAAPGEKGHLDDAVVIPTVGNSNLVEFIDFGTACLGGCKNLGGYCRPTRPFGHIRNGGSASVHTWCGRMAVHTSPWPKLASPVLLS